MHDPNQIYSQGMIAPHQPPPPGFNPYMQPQGPYVASNGMLPLAQNMPMVITPDPIHPTKSRKKTGKTMELAPVYEQPMDHMTPDQVTQVQVEQAIKESQNPGMRLRKLRSPLNVRSCLLNLLFFVILTLVIAFLVIAFWPGVGVDRFNFGIVVRDMWYQFGLQAFFNRIGEWFSNLFSSCGSSTTDVYGAMFRLSGISF